MDAINPTRFRRALGRLGGEEFMAVLPGTEVDGALRCAERVRDAVARHPVEQDLQITVSAGVAEYRPGRKHPRAADPRRPGAVRRQAQRAQPRARQRGAHTAAEIHRPGEANPARGAVSAPAGAPATVSYDQRPGANLHPRPPSRQTDSGMFNKVFCIGFNKTGTSSMHQLFVEFGLRSWHGYYSHVPVTDPLFAQFQCFSDGDQHDFARLDRTYPGSRFILTTRRLDDWLTSRIRHIEQRRSIGATGPMREAYEANPGQAVQQWIRQRLDYHQRVAQYFAERPGDLLIINVCDSPDSAQAVATIAGFLGLRAPSGMRLPHENARSQDRVTPDRAVRSKSAVRQDLSAVFRDMQLSEELQESVFP